MTAGKLALRKKHRIGPQEIIPGTAPDSYSFIVRFVEIGTGRELYSCGASDAGHVEQIARFKFPRWLDSAETDKDGKAIRRLDPHKLRILADGMVEVSVDPWIAGCVRSR